MSAVCGACHGSGWVSRDPDIGTEQECFSCGGSGVDEEADNLAPGAMPEPSKAQQAEYYRLYKEIEADCDSIDHALGPAPYQPKSRLIHAEVVRRMNIKEAS